MNCPTCERENKTSEVTKGESVLIERDAEPDQVDTTYSCSQGHSWTLATLESA